MRCGRDEEVTDQNGRTRWVMKYFEHFFLNKDWRYISLAAISVAIAVISAHQLESRFFIAFMPSADAAKAMAILVMGGITLAAHFYAHNFKAKQVKAGTDYLNLILLVVAYGVVGFTVLSMGNFVMIEAKGFKDASKVRSAVDQAQESNTVKSAKKHRDEQIKVCNTEIARLQEELNFLAGTLYLRRKEEFGKQIQIQQRMKAEAERQYNEILNAEIRMAEAQVVRDVDAAKSGIGTGFLNKTPSLIVVVTLLILFCVGLTFEPMPKNVVPTEIFEPMAQVESRKEIHSREIIMAKGEVPVSQVFKKVEPTNLDEACLLYAQGRISAETGWSQRRIAKDFADGNVSLVHVKIKKYALPLLSSGMSGQDINSV